MDSFVKPDFFPLHSVPERDTLIDGTEGLIEVIEVEGESFGFGPLVGAGTVHMSGDPKEGFVKSLKEMEVLTSIP